MVTNREIDNYHTRVEVIDIRMIVDSTMVARIVEKMEYIDLGVI